MGQKYTTQSLTGYNSSPPVDDSTQSEANKVKWSSHINKIGDPLKDQVANIDTALVTMADIGPDAKAANYMTVAGDHQKTIEADTASITITLLAVASAPTGYSVTVKNTSAGTVTVTGTGAETIDGNGSIMLAPNESTVVQLNNGQTGYISLQQTASDITADAQVYKGTAAGTADAITVTLIPALASLTDGTVIFVRAFLANATSTPTINCNGLGAKTIVKLGDQPLSVGDIARVDHELILRYNGTNDAWELLNPKATPETKDWGTVSTAVTVDLEDAMFHLIEVSASLTMTFACADANHRATIAIHNTNSSTITPAGIDNNSPTLTVGTNVQDIVGLIKSHGKITLVGLMDNQSAT